MPGLVGELEGLTVDLAARERQHWMLGRDSGCDLRFDDAGAIRYQATVFRYNDRFFVLDHSRNSTHLTEKKDGGISQATRSPRPRHS